MTERLAEHGILMKSCREVKYLRNATIVSVLLIRVGGRRLKVAECRPGRLGEKIDRVSSSTSFVGRACYSRRER